MCKWSMQDRSPLFQFAARSFVLTWAVAAPLMAMFAWFNMVVRLGMAPSPDVFAGPLMVSLVMAVAITAINSMSFIKLHAAEEEKARELRETQIEIIETLSEVAESRCGETGAHIKRVAEYSRLLAQLAGLPEDEVAQVKAAAPLHDVGKVGTPDSVLLKPGKLTQDEFAIMKEHAEIGYRILADSTKPILKAAAIIARNHHEKWDGTGYPQQLSGEAIHVYGRIVAIADVFDALGTERVYKKAWSDEQIFAYFMEQAGRHFDPHLANLLMTHFDRFVAIRKQYA